MTIGVTVKLKVPFPLPVVVGPPLRVNIQPPFAVTVPVIVVLLPLQTEVFALVIVAEGLAFTVTGCAGDVDEHPLPSVTV